MPKARQEIIQQRIQQAVLYLLIPLSCAVKAWLMGQDLNWDLQNYHLYNAYAFLNDRQQLDLAPAGLQTWINPSLDIMWYLLLQISSPGVAAVVVGFLHGLNFVLVYEIARRVLPTTAWHKPLAWLTGLAAVLSVGFRSELGGSMHDNIVSLFMLGALLLVVRAQQNSRLTAAWPTLIVAGLIAGLACALKLVVACYALALCFAILLVPRAWLDRLAGATVYSTGVCTGLALAGGYWFWQNWINFGNPLFPQFNNVFRGEMANDSMTRDLRFVPNSAWEYLTYPFQMTVNPTRVSELQYVQYSWLAIYALVLMVAAQAIFRFVSRKSEVLSDNALPLSRSAWLVFWFFCCGYLLWLHLFGIYRYLVTIELLLPLMVLLASVLLSRRIWPGLLVVAALTLANSRGVPDWGHSAWGDETFSIERPQDISDVDVVLLLGQPLGWLVPALDLPIPFLQIDPNFSFNRSTYREVLREKIPEGAAVRVIFNPQLYAADVAQAKVAYMGYTLAIAECQPMAAYLGSQLFHHQYCPARPDANWFPD